MFIDLKTVATDLCSKFASTPRGTAIGVLAALIVAVGFIALRLLFKPHSDSSLPLLAEISYGHPSTPSSEQETEPTDSELFIGFSECVTPPQPKKDDYVISGD